MRVLVAENIGASGVELLTRHFEVDVGVNGDIAERIGDYDGLIVRSATRTLTGTPRPSWRRPSRCRR